MDVIGTRPELPEIALNIICIPLKFLYTSAHNPSIVLPGIVLLGNNETPCPLPPAKVNDHNLITNDSDLQHQWDGSYPYDGHQPVG